MHAGIFLDLNESEVHVRMSRLRFTMAEPTPISTLQARKICDGRGESKFLMQKKFKLRGLDLNQRRPGYESDFWPIVVQPSTNRSRKILRISGSCCLVLSAFVPRTRTENVHVGIALGRYMDG